MSEPAPAPFQKEKTFSSYNREQGNNYANARPDYHPSVYEAVLNSHTSTGGQFDMLVDVGCGPGLAALALAPHFSSTIGLDPSEGMITTARSLGGSTSNPVRFEISTAEELGRDLSPPIQDSSVDLITASNAAHWFDMSRFWQSAARVLKPGGTVAIWTSGDARIHPSMPNAVAIQSALDKHEEDHLLPYFVPGNLLTRNRYIDLPLPWTLAEPVPGFDKGLFSRKDWGLGEEFFGGAQEAGLDIFEKVMATASPQTRWNQAHPDLVGTDRDVVKILRGEIERLLHEAGVEKGKETVKAMVHGALLIVKKEHVAV